VVVFEYVNHKGVSMARKQSGRCGIREAHFALTLCMAATAWSLAVKGVDGSRSRTLHRRLTRLAPVWRACGGETPRNGRCPTEILNTLRREFRGSVWDKFESWPVARLRQLTGVPFAQYPRRAVGVKLEGMYPDACKIVSNRASA
jgi:hypothetical protein